MPTAYHSSTGAVHDFCRFWFTQRHKVTGDAALPPEAYLDLIRANPPDPHHPRSVILRFRDRPHRQSRPVQDRDLFAFHTDQACVSQDAQRAVEDIGHRA